MLKKLAKVTGMYKEYLRNKIFSKAYFNVIPENPLHDDLFLVSFPKAGVTWLTFIMANVHLKMSGINQKITFFNIDDFIPDIQQTRFLKETILPFPGHRVIKSHAEYNSFYKKIIYLIRDPRDVMVSYYWFLKKLSAFSDDLSGLIHSQQYGIEAWCRHVQGWVEKPPASDKIDFIRYEDMKLKPLKVLTRIYTLLGYNIPDAVLEESIELSSFENMKKLEAYYNHGGDFRFPEFEFVRKGKSGGYKSEISPMDLEVINQTASRWLKLFGYNEE